MKQPVLGFAMCGSFCTYQPVLEALEELHTVFPDIIPIMSDVSFETDSRFGPAESFRARLETICGHEILHTIPQVEPIGPKALLDALVIAPCTGNTIAKLANGIADTPVTLAAKAHLRNEAPIILAVSTNDGLGASGENIARLRQRKHYYFVPYGQDDPAAKPQSLKADFALLPAALEAALAGRQIQPLLRERIGA